MISLPARPAAASTALLAPDFEMWNAMLGRAVNALGSAVFPDALGDALNALAPFGMMNGFFYSRQGKAFDLYNETERPRRDLIVDLYLDGAFAFDPFYDAIRTDPSPRMLVMREVAPGNFSDSEYFRRHYGMTMIGDEVGFVVPLAEAAVGVLSLCRMSETTAFSDMELQCLRQATPVVVSLGARHWFNIGGSDSRDDIGYPIAHPLLTRRETEIVMFILRGHSSPSIAANLDISPNTVKVHRQRIYAKLRISSQGELFHLFLKRRRQFMRRISPDRGDSRSRVSSARNRRYAAGR